MYEAVPRTTTTIPDDLDLLVVGAIDAGAFESKSDAIHHVLREYFDAHENDRVAAAISLYDAGEISLGRAARLAGYNRFEMRDLLLEHDVELRLGPADMDDARDEIETARNLERVTFTIGIGTRLFK